MKNIIVLRLMLATITNFANDQKNMSPELDKLIVAANREMNVDFKNEQSDGSFRGTNKFHLKAYQNFCAYVAVFIKSYVDSIDTSDELKISNLIFRYVKPTPELQNTQLLD